MKTKTHKSKWAMALCALAFFSLAATTVPAAGLLPEGTLDEGKQPQSTSEETSEVLNPRLLPAQPADVIVQEGTFSGTVIE